LHDDPDESAELLSACRGLVNGKSSMTFLGKDLHYNQVEITVNYFLKATILRVFQSTVHEKKLPDYINSLSDFEWRL
jgi:hypothetical protein